MRWSTSWCVSCRMLLSSPGYGPARLRHLRPSRRVDAGDEEPQHQQELSEAARHAHAPEQQERADESGQEGRLVEEVPDDQTKERKDPTRDAVPAAVQLET